MQVDLECQQHQTPQQPTLQGSSTSSAGMEASVCCNSRRWICSGSGWPTGGRPVSARRLKKTLPSGC